MTISTSPPVSRRAVLTGLAAIGAAAATGCRTDRDMPAPPVGGQEPTWTPPAYIPYGGVTPDLPGNQAGVAPGFFTFPTPQPRDGFPLPSTEPVDALLEGGVPNPAPEKNPNYELFRQLAGNTMSAVTVLATEYKDRFQVALSGDDLPDFVQMRTTAQFPRLLEERFADLTDLLAGDAVAQYPGLANIPTPAWTIPKVNGRLWGIPQPRPPAGRLLSTRGDLMAAKGLDLNPDLASGEDFVAMLAELTDRKNNQFAIGIDPVAWLLNSVLEMMEAPNTWEVQDGAFVHMFNSPLMLEALNESRKIIEAGYFHPNSFSDPGQAVAWWRAGTTQLYWQSFAGWGNFARVERTWDVGHVRMPKWNGGGKAPVWKLQAGYPTFVGITKQDSQDRLKELLRLADFIASPFGTAEFLAVNYGVEGTTYEMVDGEPTLNEERPGLVQGWAYCGGNASAALYVPGKEDSVRAQHAYLSEIIPTGTDNPARGLHSETDATKGASWAQRTADAMREILRGTRPVSSWTETAEAWQKDVGATIAQEYAEAAAAES